jgi:xanthosine utilization system XapX-like protein
MHAEVEPPLITTSLANHSKNWGGSFSIAARQLTLSAANCPIHMAFTTATEMFGSGVLIGLVTTLITICLTPSDPIMALYGCFAAAVGRANLGGAAPLLAMARNLLTETILSDFDLYSHLTPVHDQSIRNNDTARHSSLHRCEERASQCPCG